MCVSAVTPSGRRCLTNAAQPGSRADLRKKLRRSLTSTLGVMESSKVIRVPEMRRVAVFGNAGGGKSTLARQLAIITRLPLHSLDTIKYKPGGGEVPHNEYLKFHSELIRGDEWIIDGFGCRHVDLCRSTAIHALRLGDKASFKGLSRHTRRVAGEQSNVEQHIEQLSSTSALYGKILIGSSTNLKAIFNRFRAELKMGSCRNDLLQKDWNQFGPDAFEFEELDILTPSEDPNYNPAEDLEFLKDMWIEKLKPFGDNGYNRLPSSCT